MSPKPRDVVDAGIAAARRAARPWEYGVEDFFEPVERLRRLAAALFGTPDDPEAVAIVPAVSYGIGVAVENLPLEAGDEIVVLDEQFPSNVYPWREAARRVGARLRTVVRDDGRSWAEAILGAIGPQTAVVAVPQVHWTDGSVVDLAVVGEAARRVGAALVVDATQSLGAVPFPIDDAQPDFVVAAGYKWLFGPYGLGYLWVAPHHRDGRPLEQGWIAREGAADFSRLVDYTDRFEAGAGRYDVGERSNFVLVPMAIAALELVTGWGVVEVAATLADLTAVIAEEAAARGLEVPEPADRAPHIVGLRAPGGFPDDLGAELAARGVYVSIRGDAIRVSPHLYNDVEDVARFFAVLDAV
ncbi:MAG TPA: aminotransferase class V-fold PLP-dependent enzyme, partial [Actinobacteria bacterium]|nr:aminotransferase class V-fold PLP-dependent enzyme [Actinomycetota bacterium]